LQLLQSPQSAVGTALLESLDRLPRIPLLQEELDLLATHGRRVVALLPQVDTLLRQLLSVPTTRHLQALHEASAVVPRRHRPAGLSAAALPSAAGASAGAPDQ